MTLSAFRQAFWFVLCLAAIGIGECCAQEAGREPSSARIAGCRIGFSGRYKVGYWTPLWVTIERANSQGELVVEAEVNDSDGVPTTVSKSTDSGTEIALNLKVGRLGSPIHVRLRVGGDVLDERTMRPGTVTTSGPPQLDMPATAELLLALGPSKIGLAEAYGDRTASSGAIARHSVELNRIEDLATDWITYEGIEVLVLSAGDGALLQDLASDKLRFAAITNWVRAGGRLVVCCGGRAAEKLLAPGGPLTALVPGRLVAGRVRLNTATAIEQYSESVAPIVPQNSRSELFAPQLAATGRVELYGMGGDQLPLVIRAPMGLGEVSFVGLDLDEPQLASWSGRAAFLRHVLRPLVPDTDQDDLRQRLVTAGYDDLSGALRQNLGGSFAGVQPISFGTVIALAIGYVLILGPLDYLFVHKLLRRPRLAWITLPLILIAFTLIGLAFTQARGASGRPSLNKVELVDVDTVASTARGTYWAGIYSPTARRYSLRLEPKLPGDRSAIGADPRLSWMGLPGSGVGGMTGGAKFDVITSGYEFAAPNQLAGVPVLAAATKSVTARWTASTESLFESRLVDENDAPTGSITNRCGVALHNVRLLYKSWAYRLKDMPADASVELSDKLTPLSIPTLITGSALGGSAGTDRSGDRPSLSTEQASTLELLQVMMFYKAAGGAGFTRLPLHYQADCDLSRLLTLGRAILVAEARADGSQLIDCESNQSLGDDIDDSSLTIYRFVLPVEPAK